MQRSLPLPIVRILRRSRWSADDARAVLAAVAATGLPFLAFSRAHGVDVQRLYAWRRRLDPSLVPPQQDFVELPLAPHVPAPVPSRYEIQLPTGEILRLEGAVDPTTVGALVAALRASHPC